MIILYVITVLLRYTYAQVSQGGGTCPTWYTAHYAYPNLCIYVSSNYSEWQHVTCPAGGSLALPYNRLIHDFIISFLDHSEKYHFGLNISNGVLQWQDGEVFSERFEVWASLEMVSEGCAYYFHNNFEWEWNIAACNESKLFICQYVIPNISPNIWLIDGVFEGRVEIYHGNRWGTVTHSNPPTSLGKVICNMLDLTFVDYDVNSVISDGTGPVWLDGVNCADLLSTVDLCATSENITWGHANASHTADVKVRCQESMCNSSDLSPVAYAGQSCSGVTSINCTVTCVTLHDGSVYLHTNGLKSMTYSCSALTGMWTPALPPLDCALSLLSSSTVCMTTTMTTTTTTTETTTDTITDTITTSMTYNVTMTTTTSMTYNVTMTTTQMLQPSHCIQTTVQNTLTYSLYSPTQTDMYTGSQSINPSSVVNDFVQPTTSHIAAPPTHKYSKRTSAMYSTGTKDDNRPTSIVIGSIGVIILASLLGSAFFLDMITIGKERQVFQDAGKEPRKHARSRRSPDGRESEDGMLETATGTSSVISLDESDEYSSENLHVNEGLQTIEIAQIHPKPHIIKPEPIPLSMKLMDIPIANLCMPPDEDTGHFAAFPSRSLTGDVLEIPSQFTYQEPGESIKPVDADIEMGRFTKTKEHFPASPCSEALYDN